MMKRYLLESELKFSREEKRAFHENLKRYKQFREQVFYSRKLKEVSEAIGSIIEQAEALTLQETEDGWFDKVTVSHDLKELRNSFKLFEKTCTEATILQQRLESLYENIGIKLNRYYKL